MSFYNYINFHVARLTTRYVGEYLEGIKPEKFQLAWQKGNIQLSNVHIRPQVVDLINLPVSLVYGSIGSVNVSLPFSSLLIVGLANPKPLLIEIKDLYVVLGSKHGQDFEEEALERRYHLMRQRRLDQCDVKLIAEHAKSCMVESMKDVSSLGQSGWLARLVGRIISDVKVRITTVHIRYVYIHSETSRSFSAGVTLETMEIMTPRDPHISKVRQEAWDTQSQATKTDLLNTLDGPDSYDVDAKEFFVLNVNSEECSSKVKQFRISRISAYWNSGENSLFRCPCGTVDQYEFSCFHDLEYKRFLRALVFFSEANDPSTGSLGKQHNANAAECPNLSFVLKPFSCSFLVDLSTLLCGNMKKGQEKHTVDDGKLLTPRFSSESRVSVYKLWMELASLDIVINQTTLKDLALVIHHIKLYNSLLASVNARMQLYLPYRPEISIHSSPQIWWKYAVGCIIRRLRHEFPGAFGTKPSVFSWGEPLKQARVSLWKEDYHRLLLRQLEKTVMQSDGSDDSDDPCAEFNGGSNEDAKHLLRLQEQLPEKDLLETFVETKRQHLMWTTKMNHERNLRNGPQKDLQEGGVESALDEMALLRRFMLQKFFRSWYTWLMPKQESSNNNNLSGTSRGTRTQEAGSQEDDGEFYDVEEFDVSSGDELESFHDLVYTSWDMDSLPHSKEEGMIEKTVERHRQDRPSHDKRAPNAESVESMALREESDVVQGLLMADKTILDAFLELEAASIKLEIGCNSCLHGAITHVRARVQNGDTLSQYMTIQDYCLQYSLYNSPQRSLVHRREGLSRSLLSFLFCSKSPLHHVPLLVLDIKEVIIHWIPPIWKDISMALSLFRQSSASMNESLDLGNSLSALDYSSRLVSFKKLSLPKKLMFKEYRNCRLKISVDAPTFMFPASHVSSTWDSLSPAKVITIHLGALSIISEATRFSRNSKKAWEESRPPWGSFFAQHFRVKLQECFMEYVNHGSHQEVQGHAIISPLAVEFHVALGVVEKPKKPSFALSSCSEAGLGGERPCGGECPSQMFGGVQDSTILCNLVDIHGDLPALKISLNRQVHSGIVDAFRLVTESSGTQGRPKQSDISGESGQARPPHVEDWALSSAFPSGDKRPPEKLFQSTSLSFNDSIYQIGLAKRRGRLLKHGSSFSSSYAVGVSGSLKKSVETCSLAGCQGSGEPEAQSHERCSSTREQTLPQDESMSFDTLPLDLHASFSLQTCVVAVDCSCRFEEVVTLVTDRTSVRYTQDEWGQKNVQFKMGQITMFREKESKSSPYVYLLKTSDIEATQPRGSDKDSVEGVEADTDTSHFLICVQISLLAAFSASKIKTVHVDSEASPPLSISVQFLRHMILFFHPRPWRYFLQFWSSSPRDFYPAFPKDSCQVECANTPQGRRVATQLNHKRGGLADVQKSSQSGGLALSEPTVDRESFVFSSNETLQNSHAAPQVSREQHEQESLTKHVMPWQLDVSVLIVTCVCIQGSFETRDQEVFALCTFQDATVRLKSSPSELCLFIELKNLMIENFRSEEQLMDLARGETSSKYKPLVTLFRVLPDGGSLVQIHVKTLDKQSLAPNGVSLTLDMEIGKVEILCVVSKLLFLFNWIVNSFLETFRSSPSPCPEAQGAWMPSVSLDDMKRCLAENQTVFRHSAQQCLFSWMVKALFCDPALGKDALLYLQSVATCQRMGQHVDMDSSAFPVCPLTLREYTITIVEPTLVFPVCLVETERQCTLTVGSIRVTNSPCVEQKYGLVDDIHVVFYRVTVWCAVNEAFLVTDLTLVVHFFRSILTCFPPNPTRMAFEFSDLAICLDSSSLRCLLDIIQENILGDDPEAPERDKHTTPVLSSAQDTCQEGQGLEKDPGCVALKSCFEFTFPNIYIFLCPSLERSKTTEAALIFRADLVQCCITRNTDQVTVFDVGALSARMFFCGLPGSPFSLFLSDSHENLTHCFKRNINELRSLYYNLSENVRSRCSLFSYINDQTPSEGGDLEDQGSVASQEGNSGTDRIHCVYTSHAGVAKKLSFAIYDPRLILVREAFDAMLCFVQEFHEETRQQYAVECVSEKSVSTPGESLSLDVDLVRACVIAVNPMENDGRVLAMRGHFHAQRHTVLDVDETGDESATDTMAMRYIQHYNIDLSKVELFITDLDTLSAVEQAQQRLLTQETLDTARSKKRAEESCGAVRQHSLAPLGYILGFPASFYRTSLDVKEDAGSSESWLPEEASEKEYQKEKGILFSSFNWNDFIRFLCPQLEITLHYSFHQGYHRLNDQEKENIVMELHPLHLEVSYSDLKFLQGCLVSWLRGGKKEAEGIEPLRSFKTDASVLSNSSISFSEVRLITQMTVEMTQVTLVLCNDLEEYTSAPFLYLSASSGTLNGALKHSKSARDYMVDATVSLEMQFFNPRAVAYEPMIENLLLTVQWEKKVLLSSLSTEDDFEHIQNSLHMTLSGQKKNVLFVNLSDIFLAVCAKNHMRWNIFQSELSERKEQGCRVVTFRFAPYTLKNNTGIPLIVAPFEKEDLCLKDDFWHQQQASHYSTHQVLMPNETRRLSRFRVKVTKSSCQGPQGSSKLKLWFGYSFGFTLPKGISVNRLGVAVLPLVPTGQLPQLPLDQLNSYDNHENTWDTAEGEGSTNYIISRVSVADGQKRLSLESQIFLDVSLAPMWGLEYNMFSRHSPHSQTKRIQPLTKSPLCAFRCSDTFLVLKFRPIAPSTLSLHGMGVDEPLYEWSRQVSIASLWNKIEIVESEREKDFIASTDLFNGAEKFTSSSFPMFLPIVDLACQRLPQSSRDPGSTDLPCDLVPPLFNFCMAVQWENHVYQDVKCRQMTLAFRPPFRLQSVVPFPLSFTLSSSYKDTSQNLSEVTGLQEGQVTGRLDVNEGVALHSLAFLERISITARCLDPEGRAAEVIPENAMKLILYERRYPAESLLLDGSVQSQWRRSWATEGGSLRSCPSQHEKRMVLKVCTAEMPWKSVFCVYAVVEGLPDQTFNLTLYCPNWIVSHITPSFYFRQSFLDGEIALRFTARELDCAALNNKDFECREILGYQNQTVVFGIDFSGRSRFLCRGKQTKRSPREGVSKEFNQLRLQGIASEEDFQAALEHRRLCDTLREPLCCPLDVSSGYFGLELVETTNRYVGGCTEFIRIDELELEASHGFEMSSYYMSDMLSEVVVRVAQPFFMFGFPVTQLTLLHRFYLQNLTNVGLLFRQDATHTNFFLEPNGTIVPLEWVKKDQPHVFNLKRVGKMWQWGGRVCAKTLGLGETFLYHLALDNSYASYDAPSDECLRIEKKRVEWNHKVYAMVLTLQNVSSVVPQEGLWMVNHCSFRVHVWQHQSPTTRAFSISGNGGSVHFSWDDLLVEKLIEMIPETPNCIGGIVVNPKELVVGNRHLLRFGDTSRGKKYWCFLVMSREKGRKVLTLSPCSHQGGSYEPCPGKANIQHALIPSKMLRHVFKQNASYALEIDLPAVCFSLICDLSRASHLVSLRESLNRKNAHVNPLLWNKLKDACEARDFHLPSHASPQEFVCVYLSEVNFLRCVNYTEQFVCVTVADIQVDNCDTKAIFPVLFQPLGIPSSTTLQHFELYQLTEGVSLVVNLNEQPLMDIVCITALDPLDSPELKYIKFLRVIILGVSIKADMNFVTTALEFAKRWKNALQLSETPSQGKINPLGQEHLLQDAQAMTLRYSHQKSPRVYVKELVVHPILLQASFNPASFSTHSTRDERKFLVKGFFLRFLSSIGSFQDLPIRFSALKLDDVMSNSSSLCNRVRSFYLTQFWTSALTVAGNMDFLGNPVSTLSHLGAGLGDLVAEPVRALHEQKKSSQVFEDSTSTVLHGFGKGAKSFWDNTVYGAFNVVSKVSGVAAQGLGVLALDDAYTRQKQQLGPRRQPKDAAEGLSMGAEALGKAVMGGLKGLVVEPAKAIETRGLEGLAEGVGRGVVGALVKPVAGIFEMASLAAGGIQEAAGESSGVARGRRTRKRPPRVFYASDRVFRHYSSRDAYLNDVFLYSPDIYWDLFHVESLIHDEPKHYVWAITSKELCTIIMKPGESPRLHVYCMLWQIQQCQAVSRFAFSPSTSPINDPFHSVNSPSSSLCRQKKEHRYMESSLHELLSQTRSTNSFSGGIILALRPPLPNRYIMTSSMNVSLDIVKCINDAIQQL